MTALAGLWRLDGRPDAADGCGRMLASQKLYGPDAVAQWSDGDVALGRRLMRVLPEDAYDRQPLIGGDGRYILIADLRLDNRDELIRVLQIPVRDSQTLSDAAILLVAIEQWGEACIDRLVGDYSFALWDVSRERLLLARDPLGQRPLHYHRGNGFFAFASMPKGLHALSEIPYAPDEERIAEFLVLMPEIGPQSFFRGIERVEPGHVVLITRNGLAARRHWEPSRSRIIFRRPEDYSERLRELIDEAVRCRLRGVQVVGAHLSGGFDSAAVATTAARLLAPSGGEVIAFTAVPREGYNNPAPRNRIVDEGPYAAATAAMYPNLKHVLVRSKERSPLDDLDDSFYIYDRPKLNICNAGWENSINDAARQRNLTVVLTGNAGNNGLSYDGLELLPELFRGGQWSLLWRAASALVAQRRLRYRGVLANTLGPWCPVVLWLWIHKVMTGYSYELSNYAAIHPHRLADLAARAKTRGLDFGYRPWKDSFSMRLWSLRRVDMGNYNKGVLGWWRIDERDPTADLRIIEFCLRVPTEQFLDNGVQRALARRALADRLPKLVLDETRRGLQGADWHEHLTAVRDRVTAELNRLSACPPAARAIDLPRLYRLMENWPSNGWEHEKVMAPYRLALLRAISTGHFLRRATGGNA